MPNKSLLRLLITLIALFGSGAHCWAQATPARIVYPIGDYQLGKRLLFEGLTAAASHTFETTYALSRILRNQHGIDAVPSLCRNGQALYHAGDLPAALSNLNAGLSLAYATRYWTAYINDIPTTLRPIELADGRIAWVSEQRVSRLAVYPDAWPVAIGTQALLVETQDPDRRLALTYEMIWIDAIEMFYSQAMALRLRNELLGPLTEHYPLTAQLESMYSSIRSDMPEILQRCQNVCNAIAMRGLRRSEIQVRNLLEQNLTLDSGFDHPLTSIALLELANIAISQGNIKEAQLRAGQASLLAARLNQIDVLAESLGLLIRVAEEVQPGQGLAIAENALRWVDTRFGLAYLTTIAAAMESASRTRSNSAYATLEKRFNDVFKNAEVQLPHLRAAYYATQIRQQANFGNIVASRKAWQQLVAAATGSESKSPLLPNLLQATSIQIALREGEVAKRQLIDRLSKAVERPTPAQWISASWQSLVWDNLPLNDLYTIMESEAASRNVADRTIQLLADWHDRQLRVSDPLLHRSLAFRAQLRSDAVDMENPGDELKKFHNQYAPLKQRLKDLDAQWNAFRTTAKIDGSTWSTEQKRIWTQLLQSASSQYADYLIESASAISIPNQQSQSLDFEAVRSLLKPDQAILGFFQSTDFLWGYLITRESSNVWLVPNSKQAYALQTKLLNMLGAYADYGTLMQSISSSNDWPMVSRELCKTLIPEDIQTRLASIKHLKIVPHKQLWLLPFGTLVSSVARESTYWQAKYYISYASSLSSANFSDETLAQSSHTAMLARSNFFTPVSGIDQQLQDGVTQSLPAESTTLIPLTKDAITNYPFAALNADAVVIASDLVLNDSTGTEFVKFRDQTLSLDTADTVELSSPNFLFLLGLAPHSAAQLYQNPQLIQSWLYNQTLLGTRQILWQQWPVAGESTAVIARELLNRSDSPASVSLQTSILNLWEFQLNSDQEPRFAPPNRSADATLLSGKLPVFWGGWKLTTNYLLPTKSSPNGLVNQN
jgi:hypothetical protein